MKVYFARSYPEEQELAPHSLVEILSSENRALVFSAHLEDGKIRTEFCAINYGGPLTLLPSKFTRAINFKNLKGAYDFQIDPSRRLLVKDPNIRPFYDADKIIYSNQFVVEGTPEEFIREFLLKGYQIKDNSFLPH